jgi:riboflavin kinase/FMN adenylyltransferase
LTLLIFDNPEHTVACHPRGIGLGFFDGVHRGHLELLRTLVFESNRMGIVPAVLTFPDRPESVLRPDDSFNGYLCDLEDRLALLSDCGIGETHLLTFDQTFAAISPIDFLHNYLGKRLRAKLVVVGHDYRFGRGGAGNVELLRKWAEDNQVRLIVVEQVKQGGDRISSSRLRELIVQGKVDEAISLLGRPYSLRGKVIQGRRLGSRLGFPTANISILPFLACPAHGVYATRTRVDGRTYDSITNVGLRPTVDEAAKCPLAETYLYDTNQTLYGRDIHIDFLQRIRPEMQFESIRQLVEQVNADLKQVRQWHRESELCHEKARISGVPVYVLPTDRFAQAAIYFVFYLPLKKRQAASMALLSRVLTSSCRRYPSRILLARALDGLYGATLESNQERQGDLQLITFSAGALRRWNDDSSPFSAVCDLLFDVLLDPLLDEEGLFYEDIVEAERQNLMMELSARENDRAKFAFDRCLEMFCGDRPQGLSPYGDLESLQTISRQELAKAYQTLLSQCSASIYLGGSIDADLLEACLARIRQLPVGERVKVRPSERPSPFDPAEPSAGLEKRMVEQARIVLAYQGLPPYFSHRTIAATFLNSMLGGDAHSLLFDVVREKMGLAYSVFSSHLRSLSAMFIMAGVTPEKVNDALKAIQDQLSRLTIGDFDRSLFERTARMIETGILSVNDDLSSMLAHQMYGHLYGRLMNRKESLDALRSVTPEEVSQMASGLRLVTCYVLTGMDSDFDLTSAGLFDDFEEVNEAQK